MYDLASKVKDLDFVVLTGDYLYEYQDGDTDPPFNVMVRGHKDIEGEMDELVDYRRRHSTYRLDPMLQELTRYVPMIAYWYAWWRGPWHAYAGEVRAHV